MTDTYRTHGNLDVSTLTAVLSIKRAWMYMSEHTTFVDFVFTHIHGILSDKDLCKCQNILIEFPNVLLFVFFIWRPLHFFNRSFSFYYYFCIIILWLLLLLLLYKLYILQSRTSVWHEYNIFCLENQSCPCKNFSPLFYTCYSMSVLIPTSFFTIIYKICINGI